MKHLIFTWALLRLVWESKGYSLKEIPDRLRARWPKRRGFALSSIQGKTTHGKKAPRDVARFLTSEEGLPTREGFEKPAKVVRLGLTAMSGLPSPTVAGKLDALGSQLNVADAKLDDVKYRLDDANAKLVDTKAKLDNANAKLDDTKAKVESNGGKLDALQASIAEMRAEQKSARHLTGTVLGGVLLLVGLMFAVSRTQPDMGRTEATSATYGATRLPPVSDVTKGAMERGFDVRVFLGALLDMGKKPEENWIPKQPLPGQKLAKDCDRRLAETPINGGCWVETVKPPPCELLFRYGDKCYRPASADPTKPIGMFPGVQGQP